ncbi:hexokinase-3 isoform X1 [Chroicocephalus ridibundus]|uniref:hexokinase-3 isoform X1 n=1 Tax=Chroicocephalus ridibundus TaxID=1192867 RepID=UPI002FDCE469
MFVVVGHSCPLYPRLPGRDCSGRTLPSDDAVETAEGRSSVSHQLGQRNDGPACTPVQRALLALTIPLEMLQVVKGRMMQAMSNGLSRQTHTQANVQMLPTYICSTPNGTEEGNVLVVELCQSHVRILLMTLLGDGNQSPHMTDKIFDIPGDSMQGPGEAVRGGHGRGWLLLGCPAPGRLRRAPGRCWGSRLPPTAWVLGKEEQPVTPPVPLQLFDFIAQCVRQFLAGVTSTEEYLPLGFVFPFSCKQTQLNKAELLSWSKGFSCSDVEGKDVVQLLQSAINKQELFHVEVVALMNDTVGTMMTCSTRERPCEVALVVDKGTNSCFMAEAQYVEMVEETNGRMCVNIEWGCFGDDDALNDILTPYDQRADQESSNPGKRRFEKLVGSLYLGDIVRHTLMALSAEKALFIGSNVTVLGTKGALKTQQVLEIIDTEEGMAKARVALEALGLRPSERDCCRVQQICRAVVSRSAALCAAGLAAILGYIRHSRGLERLVINVAVDGELYRAHSRFGEILQSVTGLLAPECMAALVPSVDGTGRGAAIVTAVALRLADQRREMDQLLAPLRLSRTDLERVQALMRQEMELGLGQETNANSSVRMLPTYVRGTPDGTERGEFLALDLGGTNFRVLVVRVAEDGIRMASEIYLIPTNIMQGTGEALFDHIIDCIMDFQLKQDLMEQVLPLGFTFSFPCQQLGLDKAVLLTWTKGFSASGCVGEDVVQLLREAARRKQHLALKVVAVVNDTVGTMMSCGYDDPKCEIGLIVGTGTNACYMEEMQNVGTVEGEQGRMCINMEWGAFGDNGCLDHIFTDFDRLVDEKTINPGKQRFEKLISGMYLGEIVRYILLALVEKQVLFRGKPCPRLQTRDIFKTKFLSTIEMVMPPPACGTGTVMGMVMLTVPLARGSDGLALQQVQAILQDLELDASFEDSVLVREVCQTVSLRAAQLCAAGLAAVVEKMRENRGLSQLAVTVGVDGTLYKVHPCFSQHLQKMLRELAPNCTVTFLQSEDGSGKGAALVAAVACRGAES